MKLTINLATRRYINMRQLNGWLAISLFLLAALLVYQVRTIANNQVEINKIRRESAAASSGAATGAVMLSPEQMKALDAKIAFGNDLIDNKTISWITILDKLETVVPPGVALNQVQPILKEQALTITGSARSFGHLRTLLENMEQSPDFSEVYLLSQNELKIGKTQEGLGFSISCKVSYR